MTRRFAAFGDAAPAFNFTPFDAAAGFAPITPPTKLTDFSDGSISDITKGITDGINQYYSTKLQIAQGRAAVATAKAQGSNSVQTAAAGLPSPTFLVIAGVGLAAVLLLKK